MNNLQIDGTVSQRLSNHRDDSLMPNRIRVAVVLMYFGNGGAERMVSELVSHLDLSRFEVRMFCIYGDPQNNNMEQAVLSHGVPITFIRKGLGFSPRHFLRLWRELSAFNPDIIHTHLNACMYCAPWILVHNVPMLHTIHAEPAFEAKSALRRHVMTFLYRYAKALPVAISELNRELISSFYKIPVNNVEVIVNPVDIDAFRMECPVPLRDRVFDYICVARFEGEKNHSGLISAFSKIVHERPHSDLKLALVGTGSLLDTIRAQVVEAGITDNVVFLGWRDDIPKLLRMAKCFVLPSNYEGLPMSVLEAMAAGLPVVATDAGGIPELIDGNGIMIKRGSVDELKHALETVLQSKQAWEEMSARSLELVKKYDVNSVAETYQALYERVANAD